jgi:hypothetical protein
LRLLARLSGDRFVPTALTVVFVYGLVQILWGERIPVTGGLGTYDGRRYGEIARDPRREIVEEGLDLFRLQRILPSVVVHLALRATGSSLDISAIVHAFLVLNWILQLLLVFVWRALARAAGLGLRGTWLGFVLLFVNFANLKQPYYYPVLTDTPAVLLGALALLLHLRGRLAALLGLLILASLTWPSLFVSGSLLFFCGPRPLDPQRPPRAPCATASALAALAVVALHWGFVGFSSGGPLAWLSLAVMAAYAAVLAWSLLGSARLFEWRTYSYGVRWPRLVLVLAVFVALRLVLIHASTAPGMTLSRHLRHVFLYNWGKPGLFLLAHAVYFGPVVFLLLLLWPSARDALHGLGLGITAHAVLQLAHSINAESRQLVDGLPLYALVAAMAAERCGFSARHVGLVAALGMILSKAWLPINQGEWRGPSELPAQLYFMNMGPSMTGPAQAVLAAVAFLSLVILWASLPRRPTASSTLSGAPPPARSGP